MTSCSSNAGCLINHEKIGKIPDFQQRFLNRVVRYPPKQFKSLFVGRLGKLQELDNPKMDGGCCSKLKWVAAKMSLPCCSGQNELVVERPTQRSHSINLFKNMGNVPPPPPTETWISIFRVNKTLDHLRKRKMSTFWCLFHCLISVSVFFGENARTFFSLFRFSSFHSFVQLSDFKWA